MTSQDEKPRIVAEYLGQDGWYIKYMHKNGTCTYPAEQVLEFCHKHELEAANAEITAANELIKIMETEELSTKRYIQNMEERIKELESKNQRIEAQNQRLRVLCEIEEIKKLREQLAIAKEALDFYADGYKMYEICYDGHGDSQGFMPEHDDFELGIESWTTLNHFGKRARKALAKINGADGMGE